MPGIQEPQTSYAVYFVEIGMLLSSVLKVLSVMFQSGVIEGFFGRDWGWKARRMNATFLSSAGFDFYVYAPKGDAYLRRRWREPMPTSVIEELHELSTHCHAAHIRFGVGLSPFEVYLNYDQAARTALQAKVRELQSAGIDVLCILFDDMRGDLSGLAEIQARIVADITSWSSAGQFIVCPTYYSLDPRLATVFGRPPGAYLENFGRLMDSAIEIFWTGERVISSTYPAPHLEMVAEQLRRQPFIWDNHIANDSRLRTQHLYLDAPAPGWALPTDLAAGIAINPMNQPHLSQLALTAYSTLLTSHGNGRRPFAEIARQLCGDELGRRICEDANVLQYDGLENVLGAHKEDMLEFYESVPSAHAVEMAAFLRGEYRFDPACLTD